MISTRPVTEIQNASQEWIVVILGYLSLWICQRAVSSKIYSDLAGVQCPIYLYTYNAYNTARWLCIHAIHSIGMFFCHHRTVCSTTVQWLSQHWLRLGRVSVASLVFLQCFSTLPFKQDDGDDAVNDNVNSNVYDDIDNNFFSLSKEFSLKLLGLSPS